MRRIFWPHFQGKSAVPEVARRCAVTDPAHRENFREDHCTGIRHNVVGHRGQSLGARPRSPEHFGIRASRHCQPAIPSGNTSVRKRPLAVINEGTGNEFVTCAFTTEEVSINVVGFGTRLSNVSAVPATVNCTAVVGEELENAEYFVKSITLAPGADGQIT